MCKMLNISCQIPVSVLTSVKLKTVSKVIKKEEPLNLNLEEPSEMKSLAIFIIKHTYYLNYKNEAFRN